MSTDSSSSDSSRGPSPPALRGLTPTAIVLGLLLSVVMGAANVYLGLKAGMTVAASIPAAVIAMGVLRGVLRRGSIQEANLVQTTASAGESLAAGIIFTIPALVMAGIWEDFHYFETSLIALAGGLLGVLMMIPMRKVFVVDDEELVYPEGVACAEVLKAGTHEEGAEYDPEAAQGIFLIIAGVLVGAVLKFGSSYFALLRGGVEWATSATIAGGKRIFFFGAEVSPALTAVGYVVGLSIAAQIFIGGALGWVIALPMLDGNDPAIEQTIEEGEAVSLGFANLAEAQGDGDDPVQLMREAGVDPDPGDVERANQLGSSRIRYIGVGAMIVGGLASIWKVRGSLLVALREMLAAMRRKKPGEVTAPTERNLPGMAILGISVFCIALIAGLYYYLIDHQKELSFGQVLGITALTTVAMIVMSFFFTAVASYIVGLVGSSNSPVSGMTITAVLATGGLVWLLGFSGVAAMIATLGVAGVVCCAACTAGDVCNDLKTGHLVRAEPRAQQFMQVLGVVVAAFVLSPVMEVLHQGSINEGTGGIGGSELKAPQAGLFSALVRGFFEEGGDPLPNDMLAWGVGIGLVLLVIDFFLERRESNFRLHVMPVAVGIYLSLGLAVPILLGGILHHVVSRRGGADKERRLKRGVLIASGVIAGESLIGVLLGFFAWVGISDLHGDHAVFGNIFGTREVAETSVKANDAGVMEVVTDSSTKLTPTGETAIEVFSLLVLVGVAGWMYYKSKQRAV